MWQFKIRGQEKNKREMEREKKREKRERKKERYDKIGGHFVWNVVRNYLCPFYN